MTTEIVDYTGKAAKGFVGGRSIPQLVCRNIRHAWKIQRFEAVGNEERTAYSLLKWEQVVARRLTCTRCDTGRVEYFGRDNPMKPFVKVIHRYEYPEGYLYKGDDPAPDRGVYFDELLERHVFG